VHRTINRLAREGAEAVYGDASKVKLAVVIQD
jgi:hypothetical protein